MDSAASARERARGGFLLTLAIAGVLLAVTAVIQLPHGYPGAASSPGEADAAWVLWPQGWNLFADGENAPELVAYTPGPSGWRSAVLGPQGQSHNLFGLRRSPRLQAHEIEALVSAVPPGSWRACGAYAVGACAAAAPVVSTRSPSAHPTLCGQVAVTSETLDRWGSGSPPGRWRVDRVAVLEVRCG